MLDSKTAQDMMVTKLVTLSPDKHVYDGIGRLLRHRITGAPVVDRDRTFLGVFSEKSCLSVLDVMARSACNDLRTLQCSVTANQFMATKLVTLEPNTDVFTAIDSLLKNRISGAPVIDQHGTFLGVFSEKDSMRVLISAAYDQLPTTKVGALMNRDFDRVISPDTNLFDVAQKFLDTPLRRLVVVQNGKLIGQISRRDVLKAEQRFSKNVRHRVKVLADQITAGHQTGDFRPDDTTQSNRVSYFMDRHAKTIETDTDLMRVAELFLATPYRRLPVVETGKLVGQISRRDLLQVAHTLTPSTPPRKKNLLYLSSILDRQDAPFG